MLLQVTIFKLKRLLIENKMLWLKEIEKIWEKA